MSYLDPTLSTLQSYEGVGVCVGARRRGSDSDRGGCGQQHKCIWGEQAKEPDAGCVRWSRREWDSVVQNQADDPGHYSFAAGVRDGQGQVLTVWHWHVVSANFPASKVRAFVDYSVARLRTHPHDITRIEDWNSNGRLYTHPRSLFKHDGQVSTQEYRNSNEFRALYAGLM